MAGPGDERDLLKSAAGSTPECLSPGELAMLVDQVETEASERKRLHLSSCSRCRTEFELLRDVAAAEAKPDEEAALDWMVPRVNAHIAKLTSPGKRHPTLASARFRQVALIAASLIVTVGIAVLMLPRRQVDLGPASANAPDVFRSTSLRVVVPRGDIAEPPSEFNWEAVTKATRYEVRVTEVDGTELWKTSVNGTAAIPSQGLKRRMLPAKTLLWSVTALDPNGTVIAASGSVKFRVALKTKD